MTSPIDQRASGALPESDALYAPGLVRFQRVNGEHVMWRAPKRDVKNGYVPKTLSFSRGLEEIEIARRCREQWQDLLDWRSGIPKTIQYTIGWLVDHYLKDEDSPFRSLRSNTQANYRNECAIIKRTLGDVRFDPQRGIGNSAIPRILGRDLIRWHRNFGRPVERLGEDGEPQKNQFGETVMVASAPSRARHLIMMVRTLFRYAVTIGAPGAKEIRDIMQNMEWPSPPARNVAPTREQVYTLAEKALEQGYRSMAITTLAQFELNERRISIIGIWETIDRWRPGWLWSGMSKDWVIRYYQNKRGLNERVYDLKDIPRLRELLSSIPEDERVGPIVKCESSGKPWTRRYYAEEFRRIARLTGWPDDLWSMDLRAAGATESDSIEGITDRALQDSGGWADPKIVGRYRRHKQRNAQTVVKLRQARSTKNT